MSPTELSAHHTVAVIGGAVAGAQVARLLADRGARVVVIEQNVRPFGKIEDGLPRWHSALRDKEFLRIAELLEHPRIAFLPQTKLGRDVGFEELVADWGLSAIVLANGVWRDRPLPIEGAEAYEGKGLIYQNPFIIGFNHAHDPAYDGPSFDVPDGALVVGGGLASIDVVKVIMLENARARLAERGHEVDIEALEKAGIPKTCQSLGLEMSDLGLKPCSLVYRRRAEDMPLSEMPEDAPPERRAKIEGSRRKILERAQAKFGFEFIPLASPEGLLVENDRLVGLRLRRLRPGEGRRLEPTDETTEVRAEAVISSIGSIPEPLAGLPMKGELFQFSDWEMGTFEGLPTVFSAGNVVTGKGNIVASRRHATQIGVHVASAYLGLEPAPEGTLTAGMHAVAKADAEQTLRGVAQTQPASPEGLARFEQRIAERQAALGYRDLSGWLTEHPPAR